ncbi:hypothetical protein KO495_09750 [Colwellia sp. D2M02]|uniref:hypothetical protein n=1 Tax=Colwellia sp. D2M02 TaxID=2841562 RepID=UPI001C0A5FF9|nr:hypothetical protein [Colwellia sp. D2M02]MBU2893602.1 hypothetical protein [Colwellia sp. D2M02]
MLKIKKFALAAALVSASSITQATVFDGATHCSEDVAHKSQAINNLIASIGDLPALKKVALEKTGTTQNGYFVFDPQFSRSDRYFNCSVPLNDTIGHFELTIHGITEGLSGTNANCLISRVRKVSDGGRDKWFKFGTGKGFGWDDISDSNNPSKQFVSYATTLNNNFESDAILTFKCRSTWKSGSISVGQIEIK